MDIIIFWQCKHLTHPLHKVCKITTVLMSSCVAVDDDLTLICLGSWITSTSHHNHQQCNGHHHQLHRWRSKFRGVAQSTNTRKSLALFSSSCQYVTSWLGVGLTSRSYVTSLGCAEFTMDHVVRRTERSRLLTSYILQEPEATKKEHSAHTICRSDGKQLSCFVCQLQLKELPS